MNIALAAHDSKKKLMQNLCIAYRGILGRHQLFATSTTGRMVEEVTSLSIKKYLSGGLGGIHQLDADIVNNNIDMLIFLRDSDSPADKDADFRSIIRSCDVHNIPFATNLATAELLIHGLDRGDLDWREMYR